MQSFLAKLNTPAVSRTALGFLGAAAVAVAGQLVVPGQMAALLAEAHVNASPVDIALLCAVVSSVLHRYTSPPTTSA